MRTGTAFTVMFLALHCSTIFAHPNEATEWQQKYERLLKDRPEIRKKVESGQATKEQVIQWLKDGGERKKSKDKYYGWTAEVRDPAEFRKTLQTVVYSGPQPGEILPTFQVTGVSGDQKGREYNPVAQAKGKPQILIFQDQSDVARKGLYLLGPVLKTIANQARAELLVSVIFLGDDPMELRPSEVAKIESVANVYQLAQSRDGRDGPGAYGLNRNVAMTIIVARDGNVLHNFAFTQPMLYPDPHVVGALAEVVGQDRQTVKNWLTGDVTR